MDGFAVRDSIAPAGDAVASSLVRSRGPEDIAPGSLVLVRAEERLRTQVSQTRDGALLTVHGWREYPSEQIVELTPPSDLRARLAVLPQSYLADREVTQRLKLATSTVKGQALLEAALRDDTSSSWPAAHYLGPLHPVLDWAGERVLVALGRGEIFAVPGAVDVPNVLLLGTLTNRAVQTGRRVMDPG